MSGELKLFIPSSKVRQPELGEPYFMNGELHIKTNNVPLACEVDIAEEITWTNCADAMPPAAAKVIVDEEGYYNITTGKQLHDLASYREIE
jgi:hypothetical protein